MRVPTQDYLEKYKTEEERIGRELEGLTKRHLYKDTPTSDIDYFVMDDFANLFALCEIKCRSKGEKNFTSKKFDEWIIPKRKWTYVEGCYKTYPTLKEFWVAVEWEDGLFLATFQKNGKYKFKEKMIKRWDRDNEVLHQLIPSKLFKKIR